MARPGPFTLNSLVPGITSLTANWSQGAPADSDKIFIQYRETGSLEWITYELTDGGDTSYTRWGLTPGTPYDFRVRGINNTDGFGDWSNTLSNVPSISAFADPLVEWNETGLTSAPDPIGVDNTGTDGTEFDLDQQMTSGGTFSRQVRNGLDCWQTDTGGGDVGLKHNGVPATTIPQPCTLYACLVPFFVDGNLRYVMRGAFADIEIRARNDGWAASINGTGLYGVGFLPGVLDGRAFILELQLNGGSTQFRIIDEAGQDSIQGGGGFPGSAIRPESAGWGGDQTPGEALPAQWYEQLVYAGVGTFDSRTAVRNLLKQKWYDDAPDLIQYTTGAASIDMIDLLFAGSGAVPIAGQALMTLEPLDFVGSGTLDVPPFTPFAPPEAPDFLRIWKHLLPRARAWRITIDKQLRQFIKGLSLTGDDVKECADQAWLDNFPQTTTRLKDWEDQFALPGSDLDEQGRRDRLDGAWKALGGMSPRYIQDILQGQGFDLYVHEWWTPGSEAGLAPGECATPRDPNSVLTDANATQKRAEAGEPDMEAGEPFAEAGNTELPVGYPLVNVINKTIRAGGVQCGLPAAQCGEAAVLCGEFTEFAKVREEYIIPTEPAKWPYFFYVGGASFPDTVVIDASRREELESLLLKHGPTHLWIGVLVQYSA